MPINRNSFPSVSVRSVRLLFSVPTLPHSSSAVPSARQHRSKAPFRSGQTNQQGSFNSHDEGFFRLDLRLCSGHVQQIAFNGNMGVASAQRRFSAGSNIVNMRSCDEFPGRELDVTGTVTFLREINCREPTVRSV